MSLKAQAPIKRWIKDFILEQSNTNEYKKHTQWYEGKMTKLNGESKLEDRTRLD